LLAARYSAADMKNRAFLKNNGTKNASEVVREKYKERERERERERKRERET
jgi:hypothetical protein